MTPRLRELMLEAGYAAPEIAGRAQKLAELIQNDCARKPLTSDELWANDDFMALNAKAGLMMKDLIDIVRSVEAMHNIK